MSADAREATKRCLIESLSNNARSISLDLDGPPEVFRELCGELGRNLRLVGRALGVRVSQGGDGILIQGNDGSVHLAATVLRQLHELGCRGFALHAFDVEQACRLISKDVTVDLVGLFAETIFVPGKNRSIHPRTLRQRDYVQALRNHDIVLGVGPAGTGKTYLAMCMAVASLKRGEFSRIVLCRPAVEAGEKLGFLPGDMAEKVNPYLRPLYDALHDLVGFDRVERMIRRGVIEVAPLAFMRGRTLNDAFAILDEAQNTTSEQMKMFLTRMGMDSRAVVTGDITQIDLPRGQVSGLVEAVRILRNVDGIKVVRFSEADVVRHPLVAAIIKAYDRKAMASNRDRPPARALQEDEPGAPGKDA